MACAQAGGNMMFRSVWAFFCLASRSRLTFGTAFLFALLCTPPVRAQVVAQYGFEDGTAQGWASFNGASAPVNSTAAAHSGTQSLLTTTNSSGAGGPGIQLTNLVPGASYQITAYVLLSSGEAATAADMTMQRSDPGCSGGTCYDTIGTYQVPG